MIIKVHLDYYYFDILFKNDYSFIIPLKYSLVFFNLKYFIDGKNFRRQ